MAYTKTQWNPGGPPGISAENLNKIEQGIADAHDIAEDARTQIEEHKNDYKAHQGVPTGAILMWSGSANNIPEGWGLCDGSTYQRADGKGTITAPDLRDRFIVGAGNEYNVGDTGGAKEVTLSTDEMPEHTHDSGDLTTDYGGSHSHSGSTSTDGEHIHIFYYSGFNYSSSPIESGDSRINYLSARDNDYWGGTEEGGEHSHSVSTSSSGYHKHSISGNTGSTGNNKAHENRPPYYALCFIIKL